MFMRVVTDVTGFGESEIKIKSARISSITVISGKVFWFALESASTTLAAL
jgi:hypothetical protein